MVVTRIKSPSSGGRHGGQRVNPSCSTLKPLDFIPKAKGRILRSGVTLPNVFCRKIPMKVWTGAWGSNIGGRNGVRQALTLYKAGWGGLSRVQLAEVGSRKLFL